MAANSTPRLARIFALVTAIGWLVLLPRIALGECMVIYVFNEASGRLELGLEKTSPCRWAIENAERRGERLRNFRIVERIDNPDDYIIYMSIDKKRGVYAVKKMRQGNWSPGERHEMYKRVRDQAVAACKQQGGVDCWYYDM